MTFQFEWYIFYVRKNFWYIYVVTFMVEMSKPYTLCRMMIFGASEMKKWGRLCGQFYLCSCTHLQTMCAMFTSSAILHFEPIVCKECLESHFSCSSFRNVNEWGDKLWILSKKLFVLITFVGNSLLNWSNLAGHLFSYIWESHVCIVEKTLNKARLGFMRNQKLYVIMHNIL